MKRWESPFSKDILTFMTVSVDGRECLKIQDKVPVIQPLYLSSSIDKEDLALIIKVVNLREEETEAEIEIMDHEAAQGYKGTVYTIAAGKEETNSFEEPDRVIPQEKKADVSSGRFSYGFSPLSLTIFRLYEKHRED